MTELDDAAYGYFMAKVCEAEQDPKLAGHKTRYARFMLERETRILYEVFGLANFYEIVFGDRMFRQLIEMVSSRYPTEDQIALDIINRRTPKFPKQMDVISIYND